MRQSISPDIIITGDPVAYDDIHLIMEYKTDDEWGPFRAPRANRYILHNDAHNPTVSSLESFDTQLTPFDARLLVISGLQMMDNFPYMTGEREARLRRVEEQIARRPASTLIHFEMASYVEMALVRLLFRHIIPFADSIGMNEQELDNLQQTLDGGEISYATESNPRVAITLDKMRAVFRQLHLNYANGDDKRRRRLVSRLHVHTLAFQAFMVTTTTDAGSDAPKWANTKNAAAKAALTAHRHVCGTAIVNPDRATLVLDDSFMTSAASSVTLSDGGDMNGAAAPPQRMHIDQADPVVCWTERLMTTTVQVQMCVAPVLVCKVAKQTAGTGDNISAAGLILQI